MDPDLNLREQIALAKSLIDDEFEVDSLDAIALAERVVALDEWIRGGGFLPDAWRERRRKP